MIYSIITLYLIYKFYILNIAGITLAQYALNLSDELYQHLRDTAKQHDKSVKELIISLIKTGLIALDASHADNKELLFREKDEEGKVTEKQIILI